MFTYILQEYFSDYSMAKLNTLVLFTVMNAAVHKYIYLFIYFCTICSVPDQVHRLVFMHDSIVGPLFMEELTDTKTRVELTAND